MAVQLSQLARRPGLWIALVLALATGVTLWWRSRGPSVRTIAAVRRDLEQHLVASGRVRVPTRVQIAAQSTSLVVAVAAAEGQRIAAGDLLIQLDDAPERAAVAQAEAAVKQARARVDQLRRVGAIVATETLRQAETNLERARADLARTESLVDKRAVPAVELENAQRSLEIARAQKTAAEAQQLAATPAGAESRVALTALLQAEAQLAGAQVRLTQTKLVALQPGTVLSRAVEPGDVVQPTRTLMVLAADADAELVINPDERNLASIALGQRARAAADAYPQQPFDATVSFIAPSIDPQRGSIEVRLAVPAPPAFLKPDMTVSIDLTVAAKRGVLTVPSDVVIDAASPTPYLLTAEAGRVARHDVVLGIHGDGAVEIAAGVSEGARVIVPDGRAPAPGARIRVED